MFIENNEASTKVNTLLHDYASSIVGRMGIPCRSKEVSVISIVMEAPMSTINSLCGKLGMIDGVKAKSLCGK